MLPMTLPLTSSQLYPSVYFTVFRPLTTLYHNQRFSLFPVSCIIHGNERKEVTHLTNDDGILHVDNLLQDDYDLLCEAHLWLEPTWWYYFCRAPGEWLNLTCVIRTFGHCHTPTFDQPNQRVWIIVIFCASWLKSKFMYGKVGSQKTCFNVHG